VNPKAMDFRRAGGVPESGWVLLAAGVIAMGVAAWFNARWTSEKSEIDRLEQLAAVEGAAQTPAPEPVRASPAQVRIDQALVELRRPWLASLRAVESATRDPVYVLSMAVDPGTGAIRLDAEADDFSQAVGYVEKLGASPLLASASLMSHETGTNPATARPVLRFTVGTRWVTP
jgi:hypothetical protein